VSGDQNGGLGAHLEWGKRVWFFLGGGMGIFVGCWARVMSKT
jgi:hypothetical protein